MTFKEFLQKEDLQGLFGNPVKSNPARVDHALDKKFFQQAAMTPSTKKRGGSDIKRMLGGQKTMSKAVMPSGDLPNSVTIKPHKAGEYFKSPKNGSTKKVKSPMGLSST